MRVAVEIDEFNGRAENLGGLLASAVRFAASISTASPREQMTNVPPTCACFVRDNAPHPNSMSSGARRSENRRKIRLDFV